MIRLCCATEAVYKIAKGSTLSLYFSENGWRRKIYYYFDIGDSGRIKRSSAVFLVDDFEDHDGVCGSIFIVVVLKKKIGFSSRMIVITLLLSGWWAVSDFDSVPQPASLLYYIRRLYCSESHSHTGYLHHPVILIIV